MRAATFVCGTVQVTQRLVRAPNALLHSGRAIVVAFACISVANAKLWRDEEDDPVSWDKGQYGGKKADVGKTSGFGDGYDADPDDDTSGPVLTMEDVSEDNEEGMEMEDVDARIEARADGTAGDHIPEDGGAPPQGEAPVLPGVGAPPGAGGAPAPDTGKTDADGYKVVDELPKGAKYFEPRPPFPSPAISDLPARPMRRVG